jgi:hypothetical protein
VAWDLLLSKPDKTRSPKFLVFLEGTMPWL